MACRLPRAVELCQAIAQEPAKAFGGRDVPLHVLTVDSQVPLISTQNLKGCCRSPSVLHFAFLSDDRNHKPRSEEAVDAFP